MLCYIYFDKLIELWKDFNSKFIENSYIHLVGI